MQFPNTLLQRVPGPQCDTIVGDTDGTKEGDGVVGSAVGTDVGALEYRKQIGDISLDGLEYDASSFKLNSIIEVAVSM